MRRRLGLLAGWVAATAVVVALGWSAVGAVAGTVTAPPPLAQPPAADDASDVAAPPPRDGGAPRMGSPTPTAPASPAPDPADATAPPAEAADTRTFDMAGGTVAVRVRGDAAELLLATPRAGFSVEVRSRGPERVDVRFSSDEHESRFRYEPGRGEQLEERADAG